MKVFKKTITCIFILMLLYLTITIGGIYKYLKEYGYSAYALPQTLAVYFGLSDGFTVYEIPNSETSVFIGRHDYIYEELFNKHGYQEINRMGLVGYYKKNNSTNKYYDFGVGLQNEFCHWFRMYRISNGYKIEDFK